MDNAINTAGLAAAWTSILVFLPKLLAFLVILIAGYFAARSLSRWTAKALQKPGFETFLNRTGLGDALQRAGFRPGQIAATILYFTVMLFALHLGFSVFGPNAISDLLTRVIAYLPNIFVAVAILVVAGFAAGMVREIVRAAIGGLSYGGLLAVAAASAIWLVGIFAALNQLQVAPHIVNGLFYAILAIIAGSAIVAIGGGGIQPMRAQWEKALGRLEEEAPRLRMEVERARSERAVEVRPEPTPLGYERAAEVDSERRAA